MNCKYLKKMLNQEKYLRIYRKGLSNGRIQASKQG